MLLLPIVVWFLGFRLSFLKILSTSGEKSSLFSSTFISFLTRTRKSLTPAEDLQYGCFVAACRRRWSRCLRLSLGLKGLFFFFAWLMVQFVVEMNWMLFCFLLVLFRWLFFFFFFKRWNKMEVLCKTWFLQSGQLEFHVSNPLFNLKMWVSLVKR